MMLGFTRSMSLMSSVSELGAMMRLAQGFFVRHGDKAIWCGCEGGTDTFGM